MQVGAVAQAWHDGSPGAVEEPCGTASWLGWHSSCWVQCPSCLTLWCCFSPARWRWGRKWGRKTTTRRATVNHPPPDTEHNWAEGLTITYPLSISVYRSMLARPSPCYRNVHVWGLTQKISPLKAQLIYVCECLSVCQPEATYWSRFVSRTRRVFELIRIG